MDVSDICVYLQMDRLKISSGVPRHMREMTSGLVRRDGVSITILANAIERQRSSGDIGFDREAVDWLEFPGTTRSAHRRWGLFGKPTFEQLGGNSEWLYLPADSYVPVEKAKLAGTIHDLYKLDSPAVGESKLDHLIARTRLKVIYKRLAKSSSVILTVSKFSADRINKLLGVPHSKIEVVGNGVAQEFIIPSDNLWPGIRKQYGLNARRYFINVGGLTPKKNAMGILGAWEKVIKEQPDMKLILVGRHREKYLSIARGLGNIIIPENLNDEELSTLYSNSLSAFLPSWYEGFGMPVLEAMAAGALAIVSDIPAFREVAGDDAIFVDPGNIKSMSRTLCEVCRDESLGRDLRQSGAVRAKRFTWERSVDNLVGALEAH